MMLQHLWRSSLLQFLSSNMCSCKKWALLILLFSSNTRPLCFLLASLDFLKAISFTSSLSSSVLCTSDKSSSSLDSSEDISQDALAPLTCTLSNNKWRSSRFFGPWFPNLTGLHLFPFSRLLYLWNYWKNVSKAHRTKAWKKNIEQWRQILPQGVYPTIS